MSVTQDEGLSTALYIIYENGIDELNNNWNEYLPHLLDYNYTISNENLRSKIAQDIREFYFGDKIISKETISNFVEVRLHYNKYIIDKYILDSERSSMMLQLCGVFFVSAYIISS